MRPYLKNIILAVILAGLKIVDVMINSGDFEMASYLVYRLGLGKPYFLPGYMVLLIKDLFPVFIFQFIEGIGIYGHFCNGSAYYFSRQRSRKRWFLTEHLRMGLRISCGLGVYLGAAVLVPGILLGKGIGIPELNILIYTALFYIGYTWLMALWINILSILLGSQTGLTLIYGLQLIFAALLLLFEHTISLEGAGLWLLKINPLANVIFTWHSSQGALSDYANAYGISFDMNFSVAYFAVFIIGFGVLGAYVVDKLDIALQNKEVVG